MAVQRYQRTKSVIFETPFRQNVQVLLTNIDFIHKINIDILQFFGNEDCDFTAVYHKNRLFFRQKQRKKAINSSKTMAN